MYQVSRAQGWFMGWEGGGRIFEMIKYYKGQSKARGARLVDAVEAAMRDEGAHAAVA